MQIAFFEALKSFWWAIERYLSSQRYLISRGVLPTSVRLLMRCDACREPWKHSERMGFKSLFWILPKSILSTRHTPTSRIWKSSSIRLLSWIELRDMCPAQTTIWLLPRKISEALPRKDSVAFLQNGGNLCNLNRALAPQGFQLDGLITPTLKAASSNPVGRTTHLQKPMAFGGCSLPQLTNTAVSWYNETPK